MTHPDPSHALIQAGLDDLQDIRNRLRGNIRALGAGQFNGPITLPEHPEAQAVRDRMAADAASRGQGVASTIDAAFDSLRQRVVGDIHGAMDTITRLEQFNAQVAQAAARPEHRARPAPADVIDVEAKDLDQTPPTAR